VPVLQHWPLVGREDEVARLSAALRAGRSVVVSAAAGVGKTRLVDEVAKSSGRPVVRLAATSSTAGLPFGVFLAIRHDGLEPHSPLAVTRMVLSRGPDVCLVVDDVHHLDDASAGLVHQLSVRGVPVLATMRSGSPVPEAVTAIWKGDDGVRLALRPLSPSEVATLLELALGGQVDTGTAHQISLRSGGNPLFIRELTIAGLESGRICQRLGVWRADGELPVGERLVDLLPVRLSALAGPRRRLAELLAVGAPLEFDLLRSLGLRDVVGALEEQGLVTVDRVPPDQPVARFAHPLYGETVSAQLTLTRRMTRYRELADAADGRRPGDRLRIGLWRVEAGQAQPARELLALASLAAPLSTELAERFASAAIVAGGGVPAHLQLANLLAHGHRHDDAERVLAGLQSTVLTTAEYVTVIATRALSLSFAPHQPKAALAVLDASPGFAAVPALQAVRASALLRDGQLTAAVDLATGVTHDGSQPSSVRLVAAFGAIASYAMMGRPDRALELAELARALLPAARGEVPEAPNTLELLVGFAHFVSGELDAEERIANEGYRRALADGADGDRLQFAQVLGRLAMMRGRPRHAERLLRETYAGDGLWWQATLPWTRALLGEALVLAGDVGPARQVVAEADEAPCSGVYRPAVLLAGALVDAAEGAVSAAVDRARRGAEMAASGGAGWFALQAWYGAARFGNRQAAREVTALAGSVTGAFGAAIATHAAAMLAGDGGAHESAADAFERIGACWYEAEARAMAVRAYRAAGWPAAAALAGERLRGTLAAVEPLATPGLVGGARWVALTSREAEVARLAADGSTDRQIAERLGVSVRTVHTHLTRVYAKLGVADRRQLAADLRSRLPIRATPDDTYRRPDA
jgi:DNA-binding CsgD family transcriptional regulator